MRGLVWDENDKTGSRISTDSTDKCGIGDAGAGIRSKNVDDRV